MHFEFLPSLYLKGLVPILTSILHYKQIDLDPTYFTKFYLKVTFKFPQGKNQVCDTKDEAVMKIHLRKSKLVYQK